MPWIDELPAEIADTISEEYKDNPNITKYNSLDDFLKGHVNAASLVGNSIRVPGEDAGESDKQEFYQKLMNHAPDLMLKPDFSEPEQNEEFWRTLGKPDEPSKYEIPEGIDFPDDIKSKLQKFAYDADLTPAQTKKFIQQMYQDHQGNIEQQNSALEEGMAELKNEWGMTVDERLGAAKKMNDEFYPGRDFESLTPAEKKSLYNISVSMTGAGPQAPNVPPQGGGMTPQEAREQAAEIMRKVHDPKSGLDHGEKMNLINKRMKLLQKFVPEFAEE